MVEPTDKTTQSESLAGEPAIVEPPRVAIWVRGARLGAHPGIEIDFLPPVDRSGWDLVHAGLP